MVFIDIKNISKLTFIILLMTLKQTSGTHYYVVSINFIRKLMLFLFW